MRRKCNAEFSCNVLPILVSRNYFDLLGRYFDVVKQQPEQGLAYAAKTYYYQISL
jgi:hypothetical protein